MLPCCGDESLVWIRYSPRSSPLNATPVTLLPAPCGGWDGKVRTRTSRCHGRQCAARRRRSRSPSCSQGPRHSAHTLSTPESSRAPLAASTRRRAARPPARAGGCLRRGGPGLASGDHSISPPSPGAARAACAAPACLMRVWNIGTHADVSSVQPTSSYRAREQMICDRSRPCRRRTDASWHLEGRQQALLVDTHDDVRERTDVMRQYGHAYRAPDPHPATARQSTRTEHRVVADTSRPAYLSPAGRTKRSSSTGASEAMQTIAR